MAATFMGYCVKCKAKREIKAPKQTQRSRQPTGSGG
jgi:hypothetical protein